MSRRRFKIKLKLYVYILSSATIIYCIAIGYISYKLQKIAYTDSIEIVKGSTREYRNKISDELNVMMESARTMRNVFTTHKKYDPAQRDAFFENILISNVEKNPNYLSVGLYWEIKALNESYNKKNGRIRNICYRANDQIKMQTEIVDTTNAEIKGIYYMLRDLNKEMIWDPYYDAVTKGLEGTLMTSLFVPIQNDAGKFEGLVGIDISLEHMNNLISGIKPFEESISYIVGGNRMLVAHTDQTLTGKDFLGTSGIDSTVFKIGLEQVKDNSSSSFTYTNAQNEEEYFVSFEPILINDDPTNWIIGVEVPTRIILKESREVLRNAIMVGVLGLILLYIIIYFIAVKISDPIIKGVEFAKSISIGNLNAQLAIQRNDEIGDLAESLSLMAARLKTILSQIIQSSGTIAESSMELLHSSVKLADGASNQAASSEEISTSMGKMVSRIQQNTRDAKETEKMAIKAAIEASRFGIQGKGFAVVAAEIKKLAERSQLAAKEINELSAHGLLQARETENMLLQIIHDIEYPATLVKQIAASSVEQKASSEEINRGIQQLNIVTQQNAGSSFELSQNSKNISKQVENLKELITYFKIEELNKK